MEIVYEHMPAIISLSVLAAGGAFFFLSKNTFGFLLNILLAIFIFGLASTLKKYRQDLDSLVYVLVDYGFVLLCFFLFLYFINQAASDEE